MTRKQRPERQELKRIVAVPPHWGAPVDTSEAALSMQSPLNARVAAGSSISIISAFRSGGVDCIYDRDTDTTPLRRAKCESEDFHWVLCSIDTHNYSPCR